ncbi:MAG: hypothetical protein GC179_29390 [Anaerolineaceae bacterium]|nr:hypothetical protein [Anaerolineaceae bacterium]
MPYRVLTLFLSTMLLMSSSIYAEDHNRLVVTWLENNSVLVWHDGDAAPTAYAAPENVASNARQLMLSADGQYVVLNAAFPGSLWLAAPTDTNLSELVPNQALPSTDNPQFVRVGNLQRGTLSTYYFNTFDQPSHYSFQNNDLWSVDAANRTFQLLLPPSEAGLFSISPDGQHIALVQSGAYDKTDGKISLVDQDGQNRQDVMAFTAVSTASDYDFYPQTFWEADSSAFNVAIPDKDLIYNDSTAFTGLWHIAADGSQSQRGSLQATFFGLPQWSDDGAFLFYLHRVGDISANQFELILAAGDGTNATVYATGEAGNISVPQWLPASHQFIYSQGEPGDYWLGQADQKPQQLSGKIFNPRFVDSTTYVFATAAGESFELRYAHLGDSSSTLIAAVHNAVPIFDALLVP